MKHPKGIRQIVYIYIKWKLLDSRFSFNLANICRALVLKPQPACLPPLTLGLKPLKDLTHWGIRPSSRDGEMMRGIAVAVLFCVCEAPSPIGSLCSIGCICPEHTGWNYHSRDSWEQTSAHHERCQTSHHNAQGAGAGHQGVSGATEGNIPAALGMKAPIQVE